jgi:hypothetical protein
MRQLTSVGYRTLQVVPYEDMLRSLHGGGEGGYPSWGRLTRWKNKQFENKEISHAAGCVFGPSPTPTQVQGDDGCSEDSVDEGTPCTPSGERRPASKCRQHSSAAVQGRGRYRTPCIATVCGPTHSRQGTFYRQGSTPCSPGHADDMAAYTHR